MPDSEVVSSIISKEGYIPINHTISRFNITEYLSIGEKAETRVKKKVKSK